MRYKGKIRTLPVWWCYITVYTELKQRASTNLKNVFVSHQNTRNFIKLNNTTHFCHHHKILRSYYCISILVGYVLWLHYWTFKYKKNLHYKHKLTLNIWTICLLYKKSNSLSMHLYMGVDSNVNAMLFPSTKEDFCSQFLRSSNSVLLCHKPLKFSRGKNFMLQMCDFLEARNCAKAELRYKLFTASILSQPMFMGKILSTC